MGEQKKIMIVAGEASGDLHGSNLIREYKKIDPEAHFYGIGSANMRAAGMEMLHDSKDIAVVGIVEVFSHFSVIYSAFSKIKRRLMEDKPDLLILIDFPDFNIRLAKHAKRAGVKVLYYISPQVWAWRKGRVKKMAKLIDKMAVIFPFEEEFYRKENMDVTFVGHPLIDCVVPMVTREEYRRNLGIQETTRLITMMPGSRSKEIERLLDEFLRAAEMISGSVPDCHFLLSSAPTVDEDAIKDAFNKCSIKGGIIKEGLYDAINASDFVITKSGTSTLETAILGVPMVIVYRASGLTYFIGKRIFSIDDSRIGLCNIVHGENVVPELIQKRANAPDISAEVLKILNDKSLYDSIKDKLKSTRALLGSSSASKRIAELVRDILHDEKVD